MANKNAGKVLLARGGPALRAAHLWLGDNPSRVHQLLSKAERARLSVIASIVRFDKGQQIYRAGDAVDAIYDLIFGVVKAYSTGPDGSEIVHAFLFADDLLGLSEEGRYPISPRVHSDGLNRSCVIVGRNEPKREGRPLPTGAHRDL
jgi:hypothetical protein